MKRETTMNAMRRILLFILITTLPGAFSAFAQTSCHDPNDRPPYSVGSGTVDVLILGDGYREADCAQFYADAKRLEENIFKDTRALGDAAPFHQYQSFFRFKAYLQPSTDPQPGISALTCVEANAHVVQNRNTPYGAAYCADGSTARLIAPTSLSGNPPVRTPNWNVLRTRADSIMPGADIVLLLVNDTFYGGTADGYGTRLATVSLDSRQEHIAKHEIGHAFFGLRDEYGAKIIGPNGCHCTEGSTTAPCEPNVTNVLERFSQPWLVKWSPWYGEGTPPFNVTNPPQQGTDWLFCYRPAPSCRMKEPGAFDPVCRQAAVKKIWDRTRLISTVSPSANQQQGTIGTPTNFSISTHGDRLNQSFTWKVDGRDVLDGYDEWFFSYTPTAPGTYQINASVKDMTSMVKDYAGRKTEQWGWKLTVPAAAQVQTSGTEQQRQEINVKFPAGATGVTVDYSIATQEAGDRTGDPWSITLAFANSTTTIKTFDGRAADPAGVKPGPVTIPVTASNSDRTLVMTVLIRNEESAEFRDSSVNATLTINSNCGVGCDPCKSDPPALGCPITMNVKGSKVHKFANYEEFFMRDIRPVYEGYFALGDSTVGIRHPRFIDFQLELPKTFKSLRAVTYAYNANGEEMQKSADYTMVNASGYSSPHIVSKSNGWWRIQVTPLEEFPPGAIPDGKKSHIVQFRVRFFVTLHDDRVGETTATVSVLDPAATPLTPLYGLYKAPMEPNRFYNKYADMRYTSLATYRWLQQNAGDTNRFYTSAWGQIAGEHTLQFSYGSDYGTDVELKLGSPSATMVDKVLEEPNNAAARESLIRTIEALRNRIYNIIDGNNLVAQVRIPYGAACHPANSGCQHDLLPGWMEPLLETGKLTDEKNRTLDLTTDPRIGERWIINDNRLIYNSGGDEFELVLDRCRLGELGNIYCGTGRPPGTGKNMRIVTHPAGTMISPGASANLSVLADGPDLLYQWYSGVAGDFSRSTPLGGETRREITVRPSASTTYWVYVWNNTGNEKSNGALVDVCVPATVATAPQSQTIDYGDGIGATLSVIGGGSTPLSYRWLDASGLVIGTGSSVFVTTKQTAMYTAEVTNRCGLAQSSATVTVRPCVPPAINFQSTQVIGNLTPGQSTTLQVGATGSPNLRYRWYANGVDTGVTSASYLVTPPVTTTYHATVSNDCGSVQSQTFTVNVCVKPTIITQPEPKNIILGQSTSLSIVPAGSEPRAVIWHTASGTPSGGGTTINVTPNVTTTYIARVSNACGAIDSNPVTVTVCVPPSVTVQPQPATITRGDSIELSVTASGDTPFTYQWFRNEVAIAGETASKLTMAPTETASYRVTVTNGCSTTSSVAVTVTVICVPPSITVPPQSHSIVDGDETTLTVTPAGTGPFSYQWFQGGTLMTGETSQTLYIAPPNTTQYFVRVTGACGTANSNVATVSVTPRCFRPIINAQPQSSTLVAGQSVELSVGVSGTSPFSFQWYANGSAVPGATNQKYLVTPSATTSYHVVITNPCNTATSATAVITVQSCDLPVIGTPPQSTVIAPGQEVTLTVAASGTAPLSYQWYAGGVAISGATANAYTTTPANSTNYHVVVTNMCGSVTSSIATVTVGVCDAPSIGEPLQSVTIVAGQQTTLRVNAAGSAVLLYQWYANGTAVSGANSAAYTVTPSATTSYHVVVSNACGTVTSNTATVTVTCVAPSMNLQPQSQTIETGQTVTLQTTSSGLQPFTWLWYANGSPVQFSNSSALTVTPSSTTSYYVVVSNACGTVTSAVATVTVVSCVPARITNEPDDVTIAPGGSTTLSVQTTGSQPRSIQWRNAAGSVIGTASSLTVSPSATTTYTVEVSNSCGSDSHTVTVSVVDCPQPTITFQPMSAEIWEGNRYFVEVVVSSPSPVTYQWYENGVLMPGKTSRAIDFPTSTTTRTYYVKVTNACGTVQSNTATITVKPCTKPAITVQPRNVTIVDGESATISVTATGTGPLHYSLVQQDMTDAGSNSTGVFSVKPPIVAPATWWYFIIVSNGCGTIFSESITVTIQSPCTPPSITTQPQNVTVAPGQSATLTVGASGSTPMTVQWFNTGGTQVGTGTSLTVEPASTTSYYARVSNSCGTQQSATATVTVADPCTAPVISFPTEDRIFPLRYGAQRTFTVTASGSNLQYQWYESSPVGATFVPINGANGPSLTVGPDEDTNYRVRVFNSCGDVTSPIFGVRMWDGIGDPPDPEDPI